MYIKHLLNIDVFSTMSFQSRGSRRSIRGRGDRGQHLWQHGGDRKIRFLVNFDANSNDFT